MLARSLTSLACLDLVPPLLIATRLSLSASLPARRNGNRGVPASIFGRELQVVGVPTWHSPAGVFTRGKKTKSTLTLDDLPQGVLPLDSRPMQDEGPAYPTVVLQARRNMQKFDNCVLLTRVGGFYELYFEHADEFGPLLNLKVAQKNTNAGPVSMVNPPQIFSPAPSLVSCRSPMSWV